MKLPKLLSDLQTPYNYGCVIQEFEDTIKNQGLIKNKTDFAGIIGVRNYETLSRIEKNKGHPKDRADAKALFVG